ncbi:MAG: ANTAR domain-containing protein [Ruminococcus sp.]|jgi:response regulator NasT|nr:ANTAR domain-containing protein [Ruminococcus sp.]
MDRALIVSGSEKGMEAVVQLLKSCGYSRISSISNGSEARRMIDSNDFELVVINTPLPDEFGHELSIMIAEASTAGIILICKSDISDEVSDKVGDFGVCVVPKPINRTVFHQSMRLVQATRSRMLGLKKENVKLLTKIDEMRLINRAKCALMQYLKFTEPQAHRYIEKQAMDTRQTRKEVALSILSMYER